MSTNAIQKQPAPDLPDTRLPKLDALNALVGTWTVAFEHVALPDVVRGQKTYEWLEGHHFLVERSHMEHPDVPDSMSVIGADDSGEGLTQHYFDSRGVSRAYKMSFKDGVWHIWRAAPGFWQRFAGTFSEDGNTIHVVGELSKDGITWTRDFVQIYKRDASGI
jgi:hypothetical protein